MAKKRIPKNAAAQALRAIPSAKRAEQSRINGKKGGRPRKARADQIREGESR